MALATKCPHCNTIFRVAHDQLKLRGGVVRCGACNEVFDGNAALVEPQARAPLPAAPYAPDAYNTDALNTESLNTEVPAPFPAAAALPEPTPFDDKMVALDTRAAEVLQADPAEAIYTLELDTAIDSTEPAAMDESGDAGFDTGETPADHAAYLPAPFSPELPIPASSADDKLDLDLDVDIETETGIETEAEIETGAGIEAESGIEAAAIDTEIDLDGAELPLAEAAPSYASADTIADAAAIDSAPPSQDAATLEIEAMSDAELASALETELAALEAEAEAGDAYKHEQAPADDRREPTFGEPPAEAIAAAAVSDGHLSDFDEMDVDEEALLQLSSAGVAASHATTSRAAHHAAGSASGAEQFAAAPHDAAEPSADTEDQEEPGFVKRDRLRRRFGKAASIGMSLGSVLLLAALLGQGVATFRNQLAAAVPKLKPALVSACATLGCKVELPTQIDDVSIEQGELQTLSDTTFSFTTLLRNQSSTAQTWPHIELILDDASDKAVLRRVFTPREYLGPDVALDKGFAPHTEQSVKLYFELGQLKASGYHIAVFYP